MVGGAEAEGATGHVHNAVALSLKANKNAAKENRSKQQQQQHQHQQEQEQQQQKATTKGQPSRSRLLFFVYPCKGLPNFVAGAKTKKVSQCFRSWRVQGRPTGI